MVIIEAAAITAAGVAAYKGGKEATIATIKTVKTKLKLSNKEQANREVCDQRKRERKERFAKVNEYRNSVRDQGRGVVPQFDWKSDSRGQAKSSGESWWGK